jgi:hypothetical protein
MTRPTTRTFTCPCGREITYQQYEHVNVAENPQLRYIALAGLLNIATCANCGRHAEFSTPFIYSDPEYRVLAYVYPSAEVPDEARMLILEKLRLTYKEIAGQQRDQSEATPSSEAGDDRVRQNGHIAAPSAGRAEELPPLRVIFGLEQFSDMMNNILSTEDRLGRLSLNTQSRSEAERGQFLDITRKLATEMGCVIDVEDLPDEYTVWLYGSRRQVGALMRALAPRG